MQERLLLFFLYELTFLYQLIVLDTTNLEFILQGDGGCNFFQWVDQVPPTFIVAKSVAHESTDCKLCKIRESENMFLRGMLGIIIVSIVLVFWDHMHKCN